MPDQLRRLLLEAPGDPTLRRLSSPPPTRTTRSASRSTGRLMRDELLEQHLSSLRVMEETVDADRLTEEQALAWLSAL